MVVMDKKKVKELMEQIDFIAHDFIDGDKQEKLQNLVSEVQEELNKSDWVSVENGLPEYNKMVWVRSKEDAQLIWSAYRTKSKTYEVDENCFLKPAVLEIPITHWKHIEKLEE